MDAISSTDQPTAGETDEHVSATQTGHLSSTPATDRLIDFVSAERSTVDLSAIFEILKNRRRRRVLRYLLEGDGTSTLSTLAEHLAAIENDKPEQLLTSQERKRVYIGLYQCHLPRMDIAGVIEFDRGTVELADWAEVLTPYVNHPPSDDREQASDPIRSSVVIAVAAVVTIGLLVPGLPSWLGTGLLLGMIGLITATSLRSMLDHRSLKTRSPVESVLPLSR